MTSIHFDQPRWRKSPSTGACARPSSPIEVLRRADDLIASGDLASLIACGAKLTDQVILMAALDEKLKTLTNHYRLQPRIAGTSAVRPPLGAVSASSCARRRVRASRIRVRGRTWGLVSTLLFLSASDRDRASWRWIRKSRVKHRLPTACRRPRRCLELWPRVDGWTVGRLQSNSKHAIFRNFSINHHGELVWTNKRPSCLPKWRFVLTLRQFWIRSCGGR